MSDPTYIKISKVYKLDRAAGRAEFSRFATEGVRLDPDKGHAVATNGAILAVVPCDVDAEDPLAATATTIPVEVFKAARKAAGRKADHLTIQTEDGVSHVTSVAGRQPFQSVQGEYPPYEHVIPKQTGQCVALNVDLLHRLADALGSSDGVVVLHFQDGKEGAVDAKGPIVVTVPSEDASSAGDPGAAPHGVLMPFIIKE